MESAAALELVRQGLITGLLVMLPVLGTALLVGVVVSVFQAVTQVQEMTLTFVPKLLAVSLVLVLLGGWMVGKLAAFTRLAFDLATRVAP